MLKKKKSQFNYDGSSNQQQSYNNPNDDQFENNNVGDTWIWGNHRCGGGAPLKDAAGNNVTNLKKVLLGDVDIDNSPSPGRPKNKSTKNRFNDERESSPDNIGDRNRSNRLSRKLIHDDDDKPIKTSKKKNVRYNDMESVTNEIDDDNYLSNNKPPRKIDKRVQPQSIPGLDNTDPSVASAANVSPQKKFMSAVKDMHNGGNSFEKDLKLKKQIEYQQLLLQQIEEKKRKKEKENREENEIKRKELAEYLMVHHKKSLGAINYDVEEDPKDTNPKKITNGMKVPSIPLNRKHMKQQQDLDDDDDDVEDYSARQYNQRLRDKDSGSSYALEQEQQQLDRRQAPVHRNKYEREEESSPRKIKKNNRNSYHEEYFSGSDIDEDHNYSQPSMNHNKVRSTHEHNKLNKQQPHKMNPPSKSSFQRNRNHYQSRDDEDHDDDDDEEHERNNNNNNNRGGIAKDKSRYVSIEEYDELSKLCDSLLSQQEQLQSELKNQASMLKALKKDGGISSKQPPLLNRSKTAFPSSIGNGRDNSRSRGVGQVHPSAGQVMIEDERSIGSHHQLPPRPSSMYSMNHKPSLGNNLSSPNNNLKVQQQKQQQVKTKFESKIHLSNTPTSSNHNINGGITSKKAAAKGLKVAFGSKVSKDNQKINQKSSQLSPNNPQKPMNQAAANILYNQGNKIASRNNDKMKNNSKNNTEHASNSNNNRLNGFAKLQLSAVRGPVVAVHDEEHSSNKRNPSNFSSPPRQNGSNNRNAPGNNIRSNQQSFDGLELRGQSSMIAVTEHDRDFISGDQLDRLLLQARQARN